MAKRISTLNCPAQIDSEWCWAAITQGILAMYGVQKDQYQIATEFLDTSFCGSFPVVLIGCNQPQSLHDCLLSQHIPPGEKEATSISFNTIAQTLTTDHPVCLRIEFTNQARAHFLLVCGFTDNNLLIVQNPKPDPINIQRETTQPYPFSFFEGEPCQISHVYLTGIPTFGPVSAELEFDFNLNEKQPNIVKTNWWQSGRRQRSIGVFAHNSQQGVVQTAVWKLTIEDQRILYVDICLPGLKGEKPRKVTRLTHSPLLNSLENRLHFLTNLDFINNLEQELRIWNDVIPTRQSIWLLPKKRDKNQDGLYPPMGQFLALFESLEGNGLLKPFE